MTNNDLPILDDIEHALDAGYRSLDGRRWPALRGRRFAVGVVVTAVIAPGAIATKSLVDGDPETPKAEATLLVDPTSPPVWRLELAQIAGKRCLILATGVPTDAACLPPTEPVGGALPSRQALGTNGTYVYGVAPPETRAVTAGSVRATIGHAVLPSGERLTVFVVRLASTRSRGTRLTARDIRRRVVGRAGL